MSISASGATEDDMDYYPWGSGATHYTATSGNLYTYTGDENDTESSSFHTSFRQLSPSLGRWQRPDPYDGSYDVTDPQSLNRYSYVENTPVDAIDPTGLQRPSSNIFLNPGWFDGNQGPLSGDNLGAGFFGAQSDEFSALSSSTWTNVRSTNLDVLTVSSVALPGSVMINFNLSQYYYQSPFAPSSFIAFEKKVIACNLSTAKKNAVSIGLDALGFIPGEKLLGATGGVIAMVGIGVASTVNSAMQGDTTGFFGGQAGTLLAAIAPAAKYAGVSAAESIPGIGTLLNVGVTARDIYHGQQDYNACMAGH